MPEDWKERVLKKIERGDGARVATELGVDPANLTRMLQPVAKGGYRSSAFAVRLGELVGEPLPGVPSDDDEGGLLLKKLRALSPVAHAEWINDLRANVAEQEKLIAKARNRRRRRPIQRT